MYTPSTLYSTHHLNTPSLLSSHFYLAPDGLTTEGPDTLTLSGDIDITPILGLDEEANLPVEQATLLVTNVHDPIAAAAAAAAASVSDPALDGTDSTVDPSVTTTPNNNPSSPPAIDYLDVNIAVDISVLPALCTPPAALPPLKAGQVAKYSQPNPLKTANKSTAAKAAQAERDVMMELRTEIAAVVKLIATEYVAKYPSPTVVPPPMSLGTPPPSPLLFPSSPLKYFHQYASKMHMTTRSQRPCHMSIHPSSQSTPTILSIHPSSPNTPPSLSLLGAPPPTGQSVVTNPDAMAERKMQFMHYLSTRSTPSPPLNASPLNTDRVLGILSRIAFLTHPPYHPPPPLPLMFMSYLFNALSVLSTSGVYHSFKERLKPKIQRVARARYGARGQALGRSSSRGLGADIVPAAEVHPLPIHTLPYPPPSILDDTMYPLSPPLHSKLLNIYTPPHHTTPHHTTPHHNTSFLSSGSSIRRGTRARARAGTAC